MAVFVCTCPFLSTAAHKGAFSELEKAAKVPILNLTGKPAFAYLWYCTLLQVSDKYMKNNIAAMARACGAHGLWQAMIVVYVMSIILQSIALSNSKSGFGHKLLGLVMIMAGTNVEAMGIPPPLAERKINEKLHG